MSRWNENNKSGKYNNSVFYKGYVVGRRNLCETINYYNAYWSLQYVKNYVDKCIEKNSIKTLENINKYSSYKINFFLDFLYNEKNDKKLSEVTEEDIEDFLYYLVNDRKLQQPRIYIGYIKRLYDYLFMHGEVKYNPADKITQTMPKEKKNTYITNTISKEQIEKAKKELPEHLKLYMFFVLSTGIKTYQISRVKWENVDLEKRIVTFDETLYFNQEVAEMLKAEKERRTKEGLNDYGYVFRSDRKEYFEKDSPISKSTMGRWCNDIGAVIGIENLRPLDFRHTAIRNLLSASGSVGMTSIIFNHPYLSTSAKYFIDENVNNELLQEYKDICEL